MNEQSQALYLPANGERMLAITTRRHPLLPGERLMLAGHDSADARGYQEDDVREAEAMARAARREQP